MDAIKEILEFLDRHSSFIQDMEDLVQSPQWPSGWLSSHQIAEEVERFQFWSGLRSRIPQRTRNAVLDLYLKRSADDSDSPWVRIDDQFMFNPDEVDIKHGKAVNSGQPQRRRHGRVSCEMLSCQFGEVMNLSASGAKVQGKGEPKHAVDDRVGIELTCLEHRLNITSRVAWIQPNESGYGMGLEFVDLTAEQAQRVRELLPLAAAVQPSGSSSEQITHWGS